jgi:hypothetical protein
MSTNSDTNQTIENADPAETYEFEKLENGGIGCYFCKCPLQDRCYAFVQMREHWDRDIMFMACHDQCPDAMIGCLVSNCRTCQREYLHMRYDGNVCVNCAHADNNNNAAVAH